MEFQIHIRGKGIKIGGDYETKSKCYTSCVNKADKKLYNHPTIKPLELVEKFIINHSNKGDTVLDPFMGSGTTGVACRNLDRDFIGIEINKEYYDIADKRINDMNILF